MFQSHSIDLSSFLVRVSSLAGVLLFALLPANLQAQTNGTWINAATNSTWGTGSNWAGGTVANGAGAIADFSMLDIAATRTVNLGGNYTVGALIFEDDTTPTNNWAVANGNGGPWALTLATTAPGETPTIQVINQAVTISAALAGTQGFKKTGVGTLALTGANTLSGGINLNEGVLNFASGSLASNVVTFTADATLGWQGAHSQDVSAFIKIEDGVTATLNTGANDITFATALQTGAVGTGSLLKNGAGTLTVTAANTYTGLTRVRQGRMILAGGDNRLSASGSIALGQGGQNGILQMGNTSGASHQTTASLAGTTGSSVVGGHGTVSILTVNNALASTYAGVIGGSGTNENNVALVKTGAGDLTLNNANNSFTGGVTLQQGTVTFSSGALSTSGQITFAGASTLEWNSGNTQDVSSRLVIQDGVIATLATNGNVVTLATALQTGPLGTGALTKGGAGTLIITAANTFKGNTRINNGRMILSGGDNRLSAETALQFGSNANSGVLQLGDANGASNQTVTGLSVTGNASSISNAIVGGSSAISTFTVNNATTVTWNQSLGGTGENENNLAFVKTGAALLTLGGNNTFTGNVDIATGILAITRAEALGSGGKIVTVRGTSAAATLRLNGGVDGIGLASNVSFLLSNDVAGANAILNAGGNNTIAGDILLTTSSAGTRTSRIRVNADSLTLQGNMAPSASATASVTAILDAAASTSLTVSGVISDTGAIALAVRKDNAGTLILKGNNTYSGVTNITAGVVQVGVGGDGTSSASAASMGSTGTGLTTVNATATLSGSGLIKGRLAIEGGALSPGDTITAAGDKIGTLWVGGNTTYTEGTILLQVKSTTLTVAGLADSLAPGYEAARSTLVTDYAAQLAASVSTSEYDHIDINGSFDWAGTGTRSVSISLDAGYDISAGDVFNLMDWLSVKNPLGLNVGDVFRAGGELGAELALPTLGNGLGWDTTYFAQHGILIVTQISNVPEPGRAALVLGGVIAVLLRRRRPFRSESHSLWSSASAIPFPRHPSQTE